MGDAVCRGGQWPPETLRSPPHPIPSSGFAPSQCLPLMREVAARRADGGREKSDYSLPQSFASQNPAACGRPGRGSGCPPDSHSLPRLRFAYPRQRGPWCGASLYISQKVLGQETRPLREERAISRSSTCGDDRRLRAATGRPYREWGSRSVGAASGRPKP